MDNHTNCACYAQLDPSTLIASMQYLEPLTLIHAFQAHPFARHYASVPPKVLKRIQETTLQQLYSTSYYPHAVYLRNKYVCALPSVSVREYTRESNPIPDKQKCVNVLAALNQKCSTLLRTQPFTNQLPCLSSLSILQASLTYPGLIQSQSRLILKQLLYLAWQLSNDQLLLTVVEATSSSLRQHVEAIQTLLDQIQHQRHLKKFVTFSNYTYFDETSINQHVLFLLRRCAYLAALRTVSEELGIVGWTDEISKDLILCVQDLPEDRKKELSEILTNDMYSMSILRNTVTRKLLELPAYKNIHNMMKKLLHVFHFKKPFSNYGCIDTPKDLPQPIVGCEAYGNGKIAFAKNTTLYLYIRKKLSQSFTVEFCKAYQIDS